ncbi:hypothetical protein [Falsiroseomonas sp. CW058]|uniref:hypothetical protein n=1 Tax=Falsiroseomonas sp. CW058 TaxID=3388664 RepID=UPI003D3128C3
MTPPEQDWRDGLFAHGSYWQLARSALWASMTRLRSFGGIALCIGLSAGGFLIDKQLLGGSWGSGAGAVTFVRTWAATGLAFGSAMLAFLIAGFTIFATVTDVRVFRALATLPDNSSPRGNARSQLQTIFLSFMLDFWHFIAFLLVCVVLGFLFAQGTPATALLGWLTSNHPELRSALIHFAVGLLGTYLLLLVVITKSFVWNVYQSVLIAIALKAEELEKQTHS